MPEIQAGAGHVVTPRSAARSARHFWGCRRAPPRFVMGPFGVTGSATGVRLVLRGRLLDRLARVGLELGVDRLDLVARASSVASTAASAPSGASTSASSGTSDSTCSCVGASSWPASACWAAGASCSGRATGAPPPRVASMLRTLLSWAVMLSRRAVAAASSRSESRRMRSACSLAEPTRAAASARAASRARADSAAAVRRSSSASRPSRSARSCTAARAWSCWAIWAVNSAAERSRRSPRVRSKSAAEAAAVARCFS